MWTLWTLFRRHRTWESLGALLAFPKITLEPPVRGGKGNKDEPGRVVKARIVRLHAEGWESLWQEIKGIRGAERERKRPKKIVVTKNAAH